MDATVAEFFDPQTNSYSYVLSDPHTGEAALIDAVLNYDAASGRMSTGSASAMLAHVEAQQLKVAWILETHIHADHLSAARYLQAQTGAPIGIGAHVVQVQAHFSQALNFESEFSANGCQFDRLLEDEDALTLGDLRIRVLHTPGHTPACVSYVCGDAVFAGDTLFMPDYGTARTDFPGGDAQALFDSIQRILALPEHTQVFVCHDYGTQTRTEFQCRSSITEQRAHNVHIHDQVSRSSYVKDRRCRDQQLKAPKLLYPAVQFNVRGGMLAPAEANGQHYFKIPVTQP